MATWDGISNGYTGPGGPVPVFHEPASTYGGDADFTVVTIDYNGVLSVTPVADGDLIDLGTLMVPVN